MSMKREIYITHEENVKYFGGKLPTWRNAFCRIMRVVNEAKDPDEIYDDYATMKTPSGVVVAVSDEIIGVVKS